MKAYPATNPAAQVPSGPNTDLHAEAVRLMNQMKPEKPEIAAKETVAGYNKRRKETTAALKPVLVQIDDAFKRHETVGGWSSMKQWCEKVGTLTYARVRQIITGKSGNEAKVKSVGLLDQVELTKDTVVRIGVEVFRLTTTPRLRPTTDGQWTLEVLVEKVATTTVGVPQKSGVYHLIGTDKDGYHSVTKCGITCPLPPTNDKKVFDCQYYGSSARQKNPTCLHCRRIQIEEEIAEFNKECAAAPTLAPAVKPTQAKKRRSIRDQYATRAQLRALGLRCGKLAERYVAAKIDEKFWMVTLEVEKAKHLDVKWVEAVEHARSCAQNIIDNEARLAPSTLDDGCQAGGVV